MRTLLPILTVVLACLLCAGCGGGARKPSGMLDKLAAGEPLRIGVKVDAPPFGFLLGGANAGFDIDIATAIAQNVGAQKIEFVPVTSASREQALLTGMVDMVAASMTITRSREERVDFTLPYFEDGQGLLVLKDSDINSYLDLPGRKVGVVAGTTSERNLMQVAPAAKLTTYSTYDELVKALGKGSVEAITSDSMILLGLGKAGASGAYRLAGDPFSTEPYGIAIRENDSDFRDALNESLQALWESGQYSLIFRTWFGPGTRYDGKINFSMTPYSP